METKKKIADYILLGIFILCLFIHILEIHNIIGVVNTYVLLIFGFLGISLLDLDIGNILRNRYILISLAIKLIISVFFTIPYYKLELISNGKVVLSNKVNIEKVGNRDFYFETYPISLKKETIEMIFSYINNHNTNKLLK